MVQLTKAKIAIGADIGGSHISCAAVDMSEHKILHHTYSIIDVDNKATADEIITLWCSAIQQTMKKAGVSEPLGIGLAMPGPFDYANGVGLFKGVEKFDNLNGVNVAEKISSIMAFENSVPVLFMNDATSFAVGAVWADDTLSKKNVLALTLGTGFGSAFILDSLPVIKDERVPEMGCLYHLAYKDGVADETFSTRGILKAHKERTGNTVKGVKDIADLANTSIEAIATFAQFGKEMAEFLSPWISKAAITDIIIGGNISKAYGLFKDTFETDIMLAGHEINVQISGENDLMAILGSARLLDENYWNKVKELLKYM